MNTESDDEFEYRYIPVALGWGAMIVGPDNIGRPIPEADALLNAIPLWVDFPEQLDQAVSIYLEVITRPEAPIRAATVTAIGQIARRYRRIPREDEVRRAITIALDDLDAAVSAAAVATLARHTGWRARRRRSRARF